MRERLIGGVLIAVLLAGSGQAIVARQRYGILEALCAAFDKDTAEWILLGCMFLPKPATTPTHTPKVLL